MDSFLGARQNNVAEHLSDRIIEIGITQPKTRQLIDNLANAPLKILGVDAKVIKDFGLLYASDLLPDGGNTCLNFLIGCRV